MINSKTQETLDLLDAHNRAGSRDIARGLVDGNYKSEGISTSSGEMMLLM